MNCRIAEPSVFRTALAALLAAVLLEGCMWGRAQVNDAGVRTRAASVVVGKTREADLGRLLGGEPTMRMPLKDRTILGYTYADTKSNGLMLMAVNFMKTQTVAETVYVELDKDGVVRHVSIPPAREIEWQFWPF